MERMLVVVFDDEVKAYEGKSALRQLEIEGSITINRAAVVAKQADGTTGVKQYDDVNPSGTFVGTSVGALIGLLGGPVGVAVGAVSGLTLGALSDVGDASVGEDYVEEVSMSLTPGKVAVVAEIEEDWTTPVDTRMASLGGTVIRRALWEMRDQLRKDEIDAVKADLAQLKQEFASANAERRAKLQSRIDQLQARIDQQKKRAQESLQAFQARGATKRDLLKKNASAVGQALKELAKTPLT
ncbi:MAG: DUF1269 domain-containing protein [Polyangia bacterium]